MVNLIGIKRLMGTSKRTGKPVDGAVLFVTYTDRDVDGSACEDFYVPAERLPSGLVLGCDLDVRYNRAGRVESVEVL